MAVAVNFREFTPQNSRDDLIRSINDAPADHAEAVLAAYDLLQRLYEKGIIEVFNGLLSAADMVIDRMADVVSSKEAISAFRIVLMVGRLLASIDPDKLSALLSMLVKRRLRC